MDVQIWCTVEMDMSIIGGCMPTIKPFVRRYYPRLLDLATSRENNSPSGGNLRPAPASGSRLRSTQLLRQPEKVFKFGFATLAQGNIGSYKPRSEGNDEHSAHDTCQHVISEVGIGRDRQRDSEKNVGES